MSRVEITKRVKDDRYVWSGKCLEENCGWRSDISTTESNIIRSCDTHTYLMHFGDILPEPIPSATQLDVFFAEITDYLYLSTTV